MKRARFPHSPNRSGYVGVGLLIATIFSAGRWSGGLFAEGSEPSQAVVSREQADFFEASIRPLLVSQCLECHNSDESSGGLRVDSRDALLTGGDTGPAMVPGNAAESLVITAVHQSGELRMPPDSRLNVSQIEALERWILMGAPWPEEAATSSRDRHASARHWAFQPLVHAPLPQVRQASWCRNPLDRFVLSQLEAQGLKPASRADRATLIRRVTYDLTGLPPSPEEMDRFLQDPNPDEDAFRNLVDRLLASPHYGVHWARHWLDVARYSDAKGYVAGSEERFFVHSSAYRDWVVRALNEDMPYDRFLMLQLAADQVDSAKKQDLAAMGFLTVGRRFLGLTHDIIDDRIDVVTRGTMGLTVMCARCHDHKYDPIPTADYYGLYGVFNNCSEQQIEITGPEAADPASDPFVRELRSRQQKLEEVLAAEKSASHQRVRQRVTDYLVAQLELHRYPEEGFNQVLGKHDMVAMIVRRWQGYLAETKQSQDPVFLAWHRFASLPTSDFAEQSQAVVDELKELPATQLNRLVAAAFRAPPESMREAAERYGKLLTDIDQQWERSVAAATEASNQPPHTLPDPDAEALRQVLYGSSSPCRVPNEPIVSIEYYFDRDTRHPIWLAQSRVDRWLMQSPNASKFAMAVALVDRSWLREPRIFRRGNPANRGDEVPRRFLSLIAGPAAPAFNHGSGRRELAQAIIDPTNPLTPRVWINRIWMHHFGSGLVRTPSDFGVRAEPPSHPRLLDWLSRRLLTEGWSTKAIHRFILLSETYQQESALDPQELAFQNASKIDPENRLLWRMPSRRLAFEEVRDALLLASGDLDPQLGGTTRDLFPADDTHRQRTLFGLVDRQYLPQVHRAFDFANPDLHIPQRSETSVPQQALFGLNHPFVARRAAALIARLERDRTTHGFPADPNESSEWEQARITWLYQQVLQRSPHDEEMQQARHFLASTNEHPTDAPPPASRAWRYGYGVFQEDTGRLGEFTPFSHFNGVSWQGGPEVPTRHLGMIRLSDTGGDAGNEGGRVVVRRWVAPRSMTVKIQSELARPATAADGVRGWIVSRRLGVLASANVPKERQPLKVEQLAVQAGEPLDFVTGCNQDSEDDDFTWDATITEVAIDGANVAGTAVAPTAHDGSDPPVTTWNAQRDFSGPTSGPLGKWDQLAQVLLLSNEFVFVD